MSQNAETPGGELHVMPEEHPMVTVRPAVEKPVQGRLRFLHRGSVVASVGVIVVGVFLLAIGGLLWCGVTSQRTLSEKANAEKVRAVGDSLARASEGLLSADEVSTLRRLIAEAAAANDLDLCRIVLPDGRVIADADPTRIALPRIPDSWGGEPGAYEESFSGEGISASWPLEIPGRGSARLEIAALTATPLAAVLEAQVGPWLIAGVALIALLFVHRHTRSRLRAMGVIRQALLVRGGGERSVGALEVSPEFGPEADAWNQLLAEREELQEQLVLREARHSLQSGRSASDDVGAACNGLPHGLVLVDESNRVKYANGAASILLQAPGDEILGADLGRFVVDERVMEAIQSAAAGPTYKRGIVEVQRGQSVAEGVLRFIIRPVRREDAGTAMVIIEDVTQQRVAEEARSTFLAQATHELRTPLTNIRLYVETALAEGEDDPATTAKCLNVINDESGRLERIVSDILSVSEIEAGSFKIRRDDVRFETLFEQLKADYEPQAAERKIKLTFGLPPKLPVVQGDRDKIALALHNLIGNALKYTEEGGQVAVNIAVDQDRVVIDVTDTGIGISETDTERIFEKFYRAKDDRVAGVTGSGMGLALARQVVRLHGGDITVQSELNKGSNFTLALPLSAEAA